jgi:LmbE family N-acetylglucosaminyl deacetylase
MRICIVSPHLDDAILSCGVMMQRRAAAGDKVFALNIFTAGTNAADRRKEEIAAQAGLGAEPHFLDELDAPDRDPNLAVFPLGAGGHIDHRTAFEAGRLITGMPVRFYEDRPYILWPGVLQGRMNQIGSDAALPAVTPQGMKDSLTSYHYLKHFVPEGDYQRETLPLYYAAATQKSAGTLKAKSDELTATEKELKTLYEALARYTSQMHLIYSSFDNFIHDSLLHEKARTGKSAYIERCWKLDAV